jgi:AraC-like DNA-binding protein
MARIVPLWSSAELSVHRFDHPLEHEDQPYEEVADGFAASFVEDGAFNLEIAEARWRVGAGDVLLVHPGLRFRASFEDRGFSDRCLTIRYLIPSGACGPGMAWGQGSPVLSNSNRIRFLYWGLKRAVERNASITAEYCAVELLSVNGQIGSPLYGPRKSAWYADRIHAARERLAKHYDRPHTTAELAQSAGMSMFHFTRVFTELVGCPPHRYLSELRLHAAHSMLRAGRGVTETCFASGFNNLSHFSRIFARRFGVAPSRLTL